MPLYCKYISKDIIAFKILINYYKMIMILKNDFEIFKCKYMYNHKTAMYMKECNRANAKGDKNVYEKGKWCQKIRHLNLIFALLPLNNGFIITYIIFHVKPLCQRIS